MALKCPRCRTEADGGNASCPECRTDIGFALRVNLAAGAVVLASGLFFLLFTVAEGNPFFVPIGSAESAIGLIVVARSSAGLRAVSTAKGRLSGDPAG